MHWTHQELEAYCSAAAASRSFECERSDHLGGFHNALREGRARGCPRAASAESLGINPEGRRRRDQDQRTWLAFGTLECLWIVVAERRSATDPDWRFHVGHRELSLAGRLRS